MEPRGFCAGVRRAISIVELALEKFGPNIFVKHEIVHNKFVIESFQKRGVVFTDDLSVIPENSVLIYSAHGVSDAIEAQAKKLRLFPIDATCPLVKKVHREVIDYEKEGYQIILVGHKSHAEIEGTRGKLKTDALIVEDLKSAWEIQVKNPDKVALATQTTLSIDDTKEIIDILQKRFPILLGNSRNDICYATQNRQDAVKEAIYHYNITHLVVVGSQNSSNSARLRDIGLKNSLPSFLVNNAGELMPSFFSYSSKVGVTAGASAPDVLVNDIIAFFQQNFGDINLKIMDGKQENVVFHLPREVRTRK